MSEKSFEQQHDRLMREAFRKLEEDRAILTGSAFSKWYISPVVSYLIILFFYAVCCFIYDTGDTVSIPFTVWIPFILLISFAARRPTLLIRG